MNNSKKDEPERKNTTFLWLFKKKYSSRYNMEVWVFNPFGFFSSREKSPAV
jgi:hypothetical protein